MPEDKKSILHAIEHSLFEFPQLPGHWDVLTFPGLRAHATPEVSHPFGNMVGVSTLTTENADSVIAQVQEFFGKRGHMVGWWLNPSSTPVDLVARLVEQAGMVLTDMGREFSCNPRVTVRRANEADRDDVIRLYEVAYPIPERLAAIYYDVLPLAGSGGAHYLAFIDGVKAPVAVSSMFSHKGSRVAVLQGAATLDEYRGHGLYTAMVAARVADARAMGQEAAVLQGDRKTSAPICVKLGFEEVCSVDLYVWGNA
jgi:GNAT superfamily N-acetyltransferase